MIAITGLKEVRESLEALGLATEKKIIRKGLRAGGKIVKSAAQAEAPSKTGLTRSKIKVFAGKSSKGTISIQIGLRAKAYTGDNFYAAFVIYGHKVGSRKLGDKRKSVAANNFLDRALSGSGQSAIDAAVEVWKDQIEQFKA